MSDDFDPRARRTYFLTEDERIVRPNGPALVGPGGRRLDLPPRAFEALNHVLQALREGLGVTIDPHQTVLSFAEAADVVDLPVETLREAADEGKLTLGEVDGLPSIVLVDLLAYEQQFLAERKAILAEMAQEAQESGIAEATAGLPPELR
jgi:hypothetical protein